VTLFFAGHQFLVSRPSLSEEGPIQADPVSAASKAPKAEESQDRDDAEDSLEGTSSTTSPPPAHSEDPSHDRKRKRVEELISSSTSASKATVGEPYAPNEDEELFDLLDLSVFADLKFYLLLASFLSSYAKSLLFIPFAVIARTRKGKLALSRY
jgi:hypothetical protein